MIDLINDPTMFREIKVPIKIFTRKAGDNINRYLAELKKLKTITEDAYRQLHASSAGPGILYGLLKFHQSDFVTNSNFPHFCRLQYSLFQCGEMACTDSGATNP